MISLLLIFIIGLTLLGSNRLATHPASASISLSPTSGPPTTKVKMSGTGFGAKETVSITFDATRVGSAKTNRNGSFSGKISIPASAPPGNHIVQATGQKSHISAQATFLVQTNWVQVGFNRQHTHFNVFENVLNPTNVSQLTQNLAIGVSTLYISPAIVNNTIYVGSVNGTDGNVYAFNATTGSTLWSQAIGADSYLSPAVINNVVYVSSDNGTFYALNATTGAILWSISLGSTLSSPTVVNNVIYISSQDGNVYALNAATGAILWESTIEGEYVISPTTYNNGIVYVSSVDINGSVTQNALNATSGKLLWRTATNGCDVSPAVANNIVYVGSSDGSINALNATTGKIVRTSTIGDIADPIDNAPAVANGVVYVSDGDLYALNATTGTILWAHSFGICKYCSPEVVNGVVYFATQDGNMYTFHLPT